MPNSSYQKGYRHEAEVRDMAKEWGLSAVRAFGSNGNSLGMKSNVDLTIENYKVQCKRRKNISKYLQPDDNISFQILREDYGENLAVIRLEELLKLIKNQK